MSRKHGEHHAAMDGKPSRSYAELSTEIGAVAQRLDRRWVDTRVHAAALNHNAREALSSPFALLGAVGLGFGVAWFFPKRREPEPAQSPQDTGASVTTSILNALNLAGMVMSMFPAAGPESGGGDAADDPR